MLPLYLNALVADKHTKQHIKSKQATNQAKSSKCDLQAPSVKQSSSQVQAPSQINSTNTSSQCQNITNYYKKQAPQKVFNPG
jgi:hypothetical protein